MSFFGPSVSKVIVLGISLEYGSLVIHSGHSHFSGRNSSYLTNNINSKFDIFPSVLPRYMGILGVLIKPLCADDQPVYLSMQVFLWEHLWGKTLKPAMETSSFLVYLRQKPGKLERVGVCCVWLRLFVCIV